MKFEGIYPRVITPYHDDYAIDCDGFERMIEHLIASRVQGIIVGGATGEYYAQSKEECVELMGIAREVISSRGPLIVGVGAIRTEDCIDGHEITNLSQRAYAPIRRNMALMFQDPVGSLSPRLTVQSLFTEPLRFTGSGGATGGPRRSGCWRWSG